VAPPTFTSSLAAAAKPFVLSRLLVCTAAWLGVIAWGLDVPEASVSWRPFTSSLIPLASLLRYDAQWYLTIARDGYAGVIAGPYFDMRPNFMPLFPMLVRGAGVSGLPLTWAGVIIANASSLVGLAALHQVVARRFDTALATRAVTVMSWFPSSLVLSSAYSEGPLMAATMGAWLAIERRRAWIAALLAACAAVTRPLGALVLIPLLLSTWREPLPPSRRLIRGVALTVPTGVALAGYLAFARHTWGDALMLTQTQAAYRGATSWPWLSFVRWWQEGPALHGYANSTIDAAVAVGALLGVIWLLRRGWWEAACFAAIGALVPLTSGLISYSRMVLAVPVLAVPLAWAVSPRDPVRRPPVMAWLWWMVSAVVLAWFSARFATWRWVA